MFDCFSKFFKAEKSGEIAKERLRLVLIHDRNDISPEVLNSLRCDMIAVIKKYLEIEESGIEIELNRENSSVALVASIPLKNMHRNAGKTRSNAR